MILASAQNAAPAANAPKIQAVFDSVEQQEYCRADSKSYVIFLEVKLHLRNVSSDSVIVASGLPDPAGGNLRPLVAQTRVALSIHDAELGHFFGDLNSAIVTRPMMIVPPIPPIIDIPHSQDFLAIGAGTESEIHVWSKFVARLGAQQTANQRTATAGSYTVQLVVPLWPNPALEDSDGKIRNPLNESGPPIISAVPTDFFSVELPFKPKAIGCGGFQAPIE